MKKTVWMLSALLLCGSVAMAQEEVTEEVVETQEVKLEGNAFHPKAGDIGVGIDATPVLYYVGNMFNGNTGNSLMLNEDWSFQLRYFLTDNSAVRAHFTFPLGTRNVEQRNHVVDQVAAYENPTNAAFLKVEDCLVTRRNNYMLRLGYEQFRGKNRLRGFYGGDVLYGFSTHTDTYSWGNKMNAGNPKPISTKDFDSNTTEAKEVRTLYQDHGVSHTFGLDAFTGVEYYFMKNACIGFEVGFTLSGTIAGKGTVREESMASGLSTPFEREYTTAEGPQSLRFNSTNPFRGALYLMFHF